MATHLHPRGHPGSPQQSAHLFVWHPPHCLLPSLSVITVEIFFFFFTVSSVLLLIVKNSNRVFDATRFILFFRSCKETISQYSGLRMCPNCIQLCIAVGWICMKLSNMAMQWRVWQGYEWHLMVSARHKSSVVHSGISKVIKALVKFSRPLGDLCRSRPSH